MTTRITGQLGTSASLLGDLELGDYDGNVTVATQSSITLGEGVGLEVLKVASSSLSLNSAATETGIADPDGIGWSKFPGKMSLGWGLSLFN